MTETTKPISKQTRSELDATAAALGIEAPETVPTVTELRSLITAYIEAGVGADPDASGDTPPEPSTAPPGDQSVAVWGSDADAPGGSQGALDGASGEPGAPDDPTAGDLVEIPTGCVVVIGLGAHDRCAFFEQESRHPDGEVFVRGGEFGIAYPTPKLMRQLGRSLSLVEPR